VSFTLRDLPSESSAAFFFFLPKSVLKREASPPFFSFFWSFWPFFCSFFVSFLAPLPFLPFPPFTVGDGERSDCVADLEGEWLVERAPEPLADRLGLYERLALLERLPLPERLYERLPL